MTTKTNDTGSQCSDPNEESKQSIQDAKEILSSGRHGYKSAHEMLAAALQNESQHH